MRCPSCNFDNSPGARFCENCGEALFKTIDIALGSESGSFFERKRELKHIFLSYSHEDIDFMRRLRADLRAEGLDVWTDKQRLEPGTQMWSEIEKAIESAGCMVVILSPDAKQSVSVKRELIYAETFGVRIFPVLARGNKRNAVPITLSDILWVDARRDSDYKEAVQILFAALCRYLNGKS